MNHSHSAPPLRRIPLAGTFNTRDLGGYPCPGGGATRFGVFLRSDCPHQLTGEDIDALYRHGVRHSIDLRSPEECAAHPSLLLAAENITGYHVSLSDKMASEDYEGDLPGSMAGLYISLLDNSAPALAEVLHLLARCEGGCLFHCAVGKDRTGVVAMLLLSLAGVAPIDIVADYAVTEIYMYEEAQRFLQMARDNNWPEAQHEYRVRSLPSSMWRVLRHLGEVHGGAEAYLQKAGLSPEELARLRQKLVAC